VILSLPQLKLEIFFTYLDQFNEYRDVLALQKPLSVTDSYVLSSVDLLLSTLNTDYSSTISKLTHLLAHGEITFDLLYAILIPRTLFTLQYPVTFIRGICELMTVTRGSGSDQTAYVLNCESIDHVNHTAGMGRVKNSWVLSKFEGTKKIQSLSIYPLKYHRDENGLRKRLTQRGNKWVALNTGVHHQHYNGVAILARSGLNLNHNVGSCVLSVVPAETDYISRRSKEE
jgi:hypothetical protein